MTTYIRKIVIMTGDHNILNYRFFRGRRMERRELRRAEFSGLLEEIEKGEIKTVITKDLSRLGRNCLQVDMYTEVLLHHTQAKSTELSWLYVAEIIVHVAYFAVVCYTFHNVFPTQSSVKMNPSFVNNNSF